MPWRLVALGILAAALSACRGTDMTPDGQVAQAALDLRGRAQRRNLSCESRSACDVLAYYGIDVSEEAFFEALPKSDNPDLGFVGDVHGPTGQLPPRGYGVHEGPIAATLTRFGLPADAHRNATPRWLKQQVYDGRPVIVWATSTLRPGERVAMHDATGRVFDATRGEHTFILTGYSGATDRVTLVDAATGKRKSVRMPAFDRAWASLDRRAVVPRHARPAEPPR